MPIDNPYADASGLRIFGFQKIKKDYDEFCFED